MINKYLPQEFEQKWVSEWEKNKVYKVESPKSKDKKSFIFPMFPYPSGAGLHVGHVRVYTGTDVVARFHRMNGYAVLHPMGWDAFGLPAENAAIKAKKNPMDMVPDHIATFKRQMKSLGFSYDWDREFTTTDPQYYKWTQWLFLQFYKMGLLYKKNTPINFCPSCKTGLAEEEVLANGTHERCGNKIEKKELPQWLFKITSYADRLLEDLNELDWPKGILEMQKNWIGKDKGLSIQFQIPNSKNQTITVWTKFWETVFGTTFLVVAPEFSWLQELVKQNKASKEVRKYVEEALSKTDEQRTRQEKDKTGVFTGYYAINPVNDTKVPIWVADYVLASVGTGAVMGVPAHDERDFVFVKKYNLPIVQVVSYKDKTIDEKVAKGEMSYEEEGTLVNSGQFNGMSAWGDGKTKMAEWMIKEGFAEWQLHYHLRDWIFSRQRYWGEPIPMIECKKCDWVPVPESELPVELPYVKSYEPTGTGESPLAAIKDWVNVKCPKCGGPAKRETDTMPNWAGSCWYFIAFSFWNKEKANPKSQAPRYKQIPNPKHQDANNLEIEKLDIENCLDTWNLEFGPSIKQWLPTDWYIGGAEHTVLHLLYARFWVKALYDLKLLHFKEPFTRLRNLGMILAEDHRKMSKSLGNVVNTDDVQKEYGADALRVYEMFMAPFDQEIAWSTKALQGAYRFVTRIWKLFHNPKQIGESLDKQLVAKLQKTIIKVTRDIPEVKFNTAIAAMMEFINEWERSSNIKHQTLSKEDAKKFLQILAPFAPFTTEEIWHEVFGEKESIHLSQWPKVETEVVVDEEITIPVQVNGKLRATIKVKHETCNVEREIEKVALENERVRKYLEGKKYKAIYVKGKILNLVIDIN